MSGPDHVIPFEDLPEGFAQSVEEPPAQPAVPRPAATIVLLRDAPAGLELLLMRRNRSAGFVPGAWVFPGGRVDAADSASRAIARLEGLTPDEAARRLGLHDAELPAIAFYLAALREAFEETGILVASRADGSPPPSAAEDEEVDALRRALMDDEVDIGAAAERLGCRIAGGAIEYIAHWITPEAEPRRYDTRFFAARVPAEAAAIVDPREMTAALWITPGEALGRLERGELPMVFPTIRTIEQLAPFDTARSALASFAAAPVRTVLPRLVTTPTGIGLEVDD